MTTEAPLKRLASLSNVAKACDVSEKTVRRMIAEGKLTGYRFGKRLIRIDVDELEAMLRPLPNAGR